MFPPDYFAARQTFRNLATRHGWALEAHPIPAKGPEGEELTRHLETCPSCAPRSAASGGPDRLTTLLRAGAGRTTDPDLPAILDRIRHRTGGATAGGDETGADESPPFAPNVLGLFAPRAPCVATTRRP